MKNLIPIQIIATSIANHGDMPEWDEAENRARYIWASLYAAGFAICEERPGRERNEWHPV